MKLQTETNLVGLLIIAFLALAMAAAYIVYFFKQKEQDFSKPQNGLLATLRFLSVFILASLLLGFLFEVVSDRIEKPLLIIGIDNSASVGKSDVDKAFVNELLAETKMNASERFDMVELSIGETTKTADSLTFDEKISNYSDFFHSVSDLYFNYNIGAVVLIGDGIINEGINSSQVVSELNAPVYSIGVGDTSIFADQAILDVAHNSNVFVGNSFPIQVEMNFVKFNAEETTIEVYLAGSLKHSEKIKIPQPDYYLSKTFNLKAEETGIKSVLVRLQTNKDEQNTNNNRSRFNIEVHDNKNKVLFLSQGPHPDIGALTTTLTHQANFEVSSENITEFEGDVADFDMVVLNQLPSAMVQRSKHFDRIAEKNIPVLTIVGPNTSLTAMNNLNLGGKLEPTNLKEDVAPYFNPQFSLFTLPSNIETYSSIYPPLLTFMGKLEIDAGYSVLAYQKITGIEMDYPLLVVGEENNRKRGVLMGEGIWRWRLREYQNYSNTETFDQLTVSLFNYLCLKTERKQFKVDYKKIVSETRPVNIQAQVFSEIFEPITSSEVHLKLQDSTNAELDYIFDARQIDYQLNLGFLQPGAYTFDATAQLGEKDFSESGSFVVQNVDIEDQNLVADYKLLRKISSLTNGKFLLKEQSQALFQLLEANASIKPISHKESSIFELIDWKWLAMFVLLLLFAEWFLRKFWGNY